MNATALNGRSLLAVFAHPDDESLACGGLLAACSAEGVRVHLLCLTRGEHGGSGPAAEVAGLRTKELEAAARELGVSGLTVLDFEDGMLPWLDEDVLAQAVARVVAAEQPDVVLTFDEDGLYWHPDHVAVHRATTAAVERLGAQGPALYYVTLPEGRMRAVAEVVGARVGSGMSPAVLGVDDLDAFGTLAPAPSLVVDVSAFAPRKLAALRCHRSQVKNGPFAHVTDDEATRLLGVEQLRRAACGSNARSFLDSFRPGTQHLCT